jgi:hypothetical protein
MRRSIAIFAQGVYPSTGPDTVILNVCEPGKLLVIQRMAIKTITGTPTLLGYGVRRGNQKLYLGSSPTTVAGTSYGSNMIVGVESDWVPFFDYTAVVLPGEYQFSFVGYVTDKLG